MTAATLNTNPDDPLRSRSGNTVAEGKARDPNAALASLLMSRGIAMDVVDSRTVRFQAVPMDATLWNKPRTNVLLRRTSLGLGAGCTVYVDRDLAYQGTDPDLIHALQGPCCRSWRLLRLPAVPGDSVGEAFFRVLETLGSPITAELRPSVAPSPAKQGTHRLDLPRYLASVSEGITREMARAAYESCFHKPLATQLAVITLRPASPRGPVLWGDTGCGRDHLMLAAAFPLLERKHVCAALRVSGARVAAGHLFPADLDAALMRLLAEALSLPNLLVMVQDLDLCVTHSPVSHALLCDALDRGLRLLASVRSEAFLNKVETDEALKRRMVPAHVETPARADFTQALQEFAQAHGVEAVPAAIETTLSLSHKEGACEPAASFGLLGAAVAERLWRGGSQLHPDDIVAVFRSHWPLNPGKE